MRNYLPILGTEVNVASVQHLIAMKLHARRTLDLADVEALRALQQPPAASQAETDG